MDQKQVHDIREWQKTATEFRRSVEKGHDCKEAGVTARGRRELKVGTLLLGNDNENVIVNKELSYF